MVSASKGYADHLLDHDFDHLDGKYRRIYDIFSATGPNVLSAKQLVSKVVSAGETMHQAFAVALRINDTVKISCLHRFFRFPASFTTVTPWDQKVFGVLGDITSHQIPLVMVDPDIFAVAGSVDVPTLPTMDETITNWGPNANEHGEFMDPMTDANGDPMYEPFTEWVTVQNSVFLPPPPVCCYTGGSTNLRCTGLERGWGSRLAR